jgi:PKD repeat protein
MQNFFNGNTYFFRANILRTFARAKKLKAGIFSLIALLFSGIAVSQTTDLTNCYGSCTSGDFVIARAFLTDINGVPIAPSACNTPGTDVNAYLSFTFTNTTNSDRDGMFISGTINNTYIAKCFPGILPKKSSTTFTDQTHVVVWHCGTDLTLTGTFIGWGSSGEQVCALACSQATPSKCRNVGNLLIQTPLSADFSSSASCVSGRDYQTIAFTGSAAGGDHNYTYLWNFGDGTSSTSLSPTHNYSSAGNFSVTFTVTDGTHTSRSATKSVAVGTCCSTPTITTQPSPQTKCAGASASFSVAFSGGNPTPTTQWQRSTDNGTTWNNLTNVSPFSGVTTTSLSISSTTISMNGHKFRAVVTSANCTPATSDAALLTVNAIPSAPSVAYNAPACDATTFSVTISSVISGAIYTITDKNGNAISGVSPASPHTASNNSNFSFSNIPTGSGYRVSVSNNSCPSASATSCGTPTSAPALLSRVGNSEIISAEIGSQTKVSAAPNPFNDRIRFSLKSSVSGQGSLDLYNMMGQKVKTVYRGYVQAGRSQNIEYSVPTTLRSNLIYLFTVGDQKTSGKLIGLK